MTEKVFTIAGRKVVRRCSAEMENSCANCRWLKNGTTKSSKRCWAPAWFPLSRINKKAGTAGRGEE